MPGGVPGNLSSQRGEGSLRSAFLPFSRRGECLSSPVSDPAFPKGLHNILYRSLIRSQSILPLPLCHDPPAFPPGTSSATGDDLRQRELRRPQAFPVELLDRHLSRAESLHTCCQSVGTLRWRPAHRLPGRVRPPPPLVSTSGPELLLVTNYLLLTTCKRSDGVSAKESARSDGVSAKRSDGVSACKSLRMLWKVRAS